MRTVRWSPSSRSNNTWSPFELDHLDDDFFLSFLAIDFQHRHNDSTGFVQDENKAVKIFRGTLAREMMKKYSLKESNTVVDNRWNFRVSHTSLNQLIATLMRYNLTVGTH